MVAYLYFHHQLGPRGSTLVVAPPISTSKTRSSLGFDPSAFGVPADAVEPDEKDWTRLDIAGREFMGVEWDAVCVGHSS